MKGLLAAAVFRAAVSITFAQGPPSAQSDKNKNPHADCPMHTTHDGSDSSAIDMRGEQGMGF